MLLTKYFFIKIPARANSLIISYLITLLIAVVQKLNEMYIL